MLNYILFELMYPTPSLIMGKVGYKLNTQINKINICFMNFITYFLKCMNYLSMR